jgi:hypothetical protein
MNNWSSVVAVAFIVAFFTLAIRSMNHAWNTKAGVEFGPAGDRKAVKMAAMMMGGTTRPSAKHARVPIRGSIAAREHVPPTIPVRRANAGTPEVPSSAEGFSKDLKADWRSKVPRIPRVAGLEVPEVPNILDEPETRTDLPR